MIGQNCLVKWNTNNDTYQWYKAIIKSVEGSNVTVIWENGRFEGHESSGVPIRDVLIRESIRDEVVSIRLNLQNTKTLVRENSEKIDQLLLNQNTVFKDLAERGFDKVQSLLEVIHGSHVATERRQKDLLKQFDGIAERMDKLNDNLERCRVLQPLISSDDEVNYDIDNLKLSLESTGSVHMYTSSGSVNMEAEDNRKPRSEKTGSPSSKKKYFSTPELGDLYSNEKLKTNGALKKRYGNNH
jgi:hypothetical protein